MNWENIKKIDAHVHVLPNEKRVELISNYGASAPWAMAEVGSLISFMDEYNVKKAILQPVNDADLYYPTRATNEFMADLVSKFPDRLMAFADLEIKGANSLYEAPYELEYGVKKLGLKGLKIHPSNLNISADDLRLVPVLRKAAELRIPVMYHSNPCMQGFYNTCSPEKINRMIKVFPDVQFITAHLGGMQYLDAIHGVTWVDISFILPQLVQLYGVEQTNRILRMFGTDRLIFGTDIPEKNYGQYFEILNQMDFSKKEIEQISYDNIMKIISS